MSGPRISRDQVIRFLRDAGWKYKDQTVRVELYGRSGSSTQRVVVPKRDHFTQTQVRGILAQAGFTTAQVETFLRDAVSS